MAITHIAEHIEEGDTVRFRTTAEDFDGRVFRREMVSTLAGRKVDLTIEQKHGTTRARLSPFHPVTIVERYAPPAREAV